MSTERAKIEAAITALDAQRQALGEEVVELALAPLRDRLAALDARDVAVTVRD